MDVFFSRRLRQVFSVIGFLGAALILVTAQEKASSSAEPKILPFPPDSDERWAPGDDGVPRHDLDNKIVELMRARPGMELAAILSRVRRP